MVEILGQVSEALLPSLVTACNGGHVLTEPSDVDQCGFIAEPEMLSVWARTPCCERLQVWDEFRGLLVHCLGAGIVEAKVVVDIPQLEL